MPKYGFRSLATIPVEAIQILLGIVDTQIDLNLDHQRLFPLLDIVMGFEKTFSAWSPKTREISGRVRSEQVEQKWISLQEHPHLVRLAELV